MQDQRSHQLADGEAGIDRAVLALLLDEDSQRPWALDEVARELGDAEDARDALTRLCDAGLVHRLDRFVFATRPAVHAARLSDD